MINYGALVYSMLERALDITPVEQGAPNEAPEIMLTDILSPVGLREVFWNDRPVEVDLGSGPGKFLVEAAQKFPDRNFLGIERLLGRVRKTRRRAFELGIDNLRLLRVEMEYAVQYLLPRESIFRFHLSFPDPWPKRRHHVRRVVDREFFDALWRALIAEGEIRIKTDHEAYFQHIARVAGESQLWNLLEWADESYPVTDFEQDFLAKDLPIYRLRAVKRNSVPQKV
ncbi:MAG TPA: tRNA (guanosine(46)-N7)-methyltransferase TrmB [Chthoniobacterales bacterium]|jgi:tRNA (guanine-N7-)-methyltransferase|nr:tRNA (guanosine(46)-N7)-methyltransferase TrmB [Chthoniobacterales bacterium]